MTRGLCLSLLILVFSSVPALGRDVHVRGYVRTDGTYVAPHVRTVPNRNRTDNYGQLNARDRAIGVPAVDRDYDGDAVPNVLDDDDDDDGLKD